MGKLNTVVSIIVSMILTVLLLLSLMVPYVFVPILLAFISLLAVSVYLLKESRNLSHKLVMKKFYCPFRKMVVEAKFRPSIFTFRTYDDVLKCSAFKDKVRCKKMCLDMPELELNSQTSV
ncbi:MAG: hypothetical protein RIG61_11500 [Deltaproteobacteria bacterium]